MAIKPEQVKRNLELARLLAQTSMLTTKLAGAIADETRRGEVLPATIGKAKSAADVYRKLVEALPIFAAENATGPSPLYRGQGN